MRIKELILEGGNVFAGKTASINRENIEPTLQAYFQELKKVFPHKANIFDKKHFNLLGSASKKAVSGDIDLAVSVEDILDKQMSDASIRLWGIDPEEVEKEFNALLKRAKSSRPEQLKIKAFLKLLTRYINSHATDLFCNEKKVTPGNIYGLFPQHSADGTQLDAGVQIDWMVGDLNWLNFSYYSSEYSPESNVKGLHRTQLLLSAFQVAGLSFDHVDGVKDKATHEVIAKDPEQALNVLSDKLGFKITQMDAENYYTLFNLFRTKMKASDFNTLINIYFKILDSTRTDIPDNLQKEWVKRRETLALTGKFLPDSSKLKRYVNAK